MDKTIMTKQEFIKEIQEHIGDGAQVKAFCIITHEDGTTAEKRRVIRGVSGNCIEMLHLICNYIEYTAERLDEPTKNILSVVSAVLNDRAEKSHMDRIKKEVFHEGVENDGQDW